MHFVASSFDQGIGNWNGSSVTGRANMFQAVSSYDQDIDNLDDSNVTTVFMFFVTIVFHQDVSKWNMSNLKIYAFNVCQVLYHAIKA